MEGCDVQFGVGHFRRDSEWCNKRGSDTLAQIKLTEDKLNAVEKELTDKEDKLIAAKAAQDKAIGTLILDNLDEQIPKERIILKLQKHFVLTEEKSTRYYEKYAIK